MIISAQSNLNKFSLLYVFDKPTQQRVFDTGLNNLTAILGNILANDSMLTNFTFL